MSITIKIKTQLNGKRIAMYQQTGTVSKFWHMMSVRQAEKALKDGIVSIGLLVNCPAVAA